MNHDVLVITSRMIFQVDVILDVIYTYICIYIYIGTTK